MGLTGRFFPLVVFMAFPFLTGFGPARTKPVPLPAPEPAFAFKARFDVFRLWEDPRSTATNPRVWLGIDTDNLATAALQLWDGGASSREVYASRDNSRPSGNARTDLTAVGFQGDRTFIALRGAPGSRPTKGGSWIEVSDETGTSGWQVEFTGDEGWNLLVRGFASLANGETLAWGTSDYDAACGGSGAIPWLAVRDVKGEWSSSRLPASFCSDIPLGAIAGAEGRSVKLVMQTGVYEGTPGTPDWKLLQKWAPAEAIQGKVQGGLATLLFTDNILRQWNARTGQLQLVAPVPAGALVPQPRDSRWFSSANGMWDALDANTAVWISSGWKRRAHCRPPIVVIPVPGPVMDPCLDMITEVQHWNGRDWKTVSAFYGNSVSSPLLLDDSRVLLPMSTEVRAVRVSRQ